MTDVSLAIQGCRSLAHLKEKEPASTDAGKKPRTGDQLLAHFLDPGPLPSARLSACSKDLAKRCYAKCLTNNEVVNTAASSPL